MPRLTSNCDICGKPLVETFTTGISDTEVLQGYKCGHAFVIEKTINDLTNIKTQAVDGSGKELRNYQTESVKFILDPPEPNVPFNCIIGHQMRLGKTMIALKALASDYKNRTPALIIVRGANLWQWIREYKVWTDTLPLGIYPIVGSKAFIPPGFSAYIISMDTFSRPGVVDMLLSFGFKLVIADECHSFKNAESKRSKALIGFLHNIQETEIHKQLTFSCPICPGTPWVEDVTIKANLKYTTKTSLFTHRTKCPHCGAAIAQACQKLDNQERSPCGIIMLSGTSIKNRADEYWVLLNILAPERYPSLERFRREWLEQDQKGKWSRINRHRWEAFRETIRPYVLRYEKEDVYTDLPPLNRLYTVIEIDDQRLKEAYNSVLDKLEGEMKSNPNFSFFSSIGDLQILRQICGMAKIKWAADYVETMLMDSDKAKIAIGIHHKSVRDNLAYSLATFGVLKLSGEDSSEQKDWIMHSFETRPERVCIINMLAGGVGMDFHYVDNILILERQWSNADEEQFEFRFYNPDKSIKNRSTNIEYILARGTIDEWWHDMIGEKRRVFGETISNHWDIKSDPGSFRQLMEQTISHRL